MSLRVVSAAILALLGTGCQMTPTTNSTPAVVSQELDSAKREMLLSKIKGLEGTWDVSVGGVPGGSIEFRVSSNGSAVREIMFPGTDHEMTNMYHLDGNSLVVTHYCGAGNQPKMRANGLIEDKIAFAMDSVGDLKSRTETYMGELTLEFVADHQVIEHWRSFTDGKPNPEHEMHMQLSRRLPAGNDPTGG
ncbi:MAG: hypothetical protein AB7O52_15220 [Planctomycetota bacterium]